MNAQNAVDEFASYIEMWEDNAGLDEALTVLQQLVTTVGEFLETEKAIRDGNPGGALLEIIPDLAHLLGISELYDENDPEREGER